MIGSPGAADETAEGTVLVAIVAGNISPPIDSRGDGSLRLRRIDGKNRAARRAKESVLNRT